MTNEHTQDVITGDRFEANPLERVFAEAAWAFTKGPQ